MSKRSASIITALFLFFICGAARGGEKPRSAEQLQAELGKAPTAATGWSNPYAQPHGEAISAGRKLFRRHCAECHGTDGHGQDKAPDLHSAFIQEAAPGTVFWFVKNGNLKRGMPSWSGLPDEQIWQIVTYLSTLH